MPVDLAKLTEEKLSPPSGDAAPPSGSIVEPNISAKIDLGPAAPLFNQRPPKLLLQKEQPKHRMILDLFSAGNSDKEIQQITGYTAPTVANLKRQPWAQERIVNDMAKLKRTVMDAIVDEAKASWIKLLELRDDPATPAAVAAKICESNLDRVFGKAAQPLAVYDGVDLDKLSDAELAKMLPPTESTAAERSSVATNSEDPSTATNG